MIVSAGSPYEAAQMLSSDLVFVFRNIRGSFTVLPAAGRLLRGSGPVPGVIEVSPRVQSTKVLESYYPKDGGIEFVFAPTTNTFAVGSPAPHAGIPGSPHQKLASSIAADESSVLGGTFTRGRNGEIMTTENSGHYGERWTDALRGQFVDYMESQTGLTVNHESWRH
jgi:hypothetical protein